MTLPSNDDINLVQKQMGNFTISDVGALLALLVDRSGTGSTSAQPASFVSFTATPTTTLAPIRSVSTIVNSILICAGRANRTANAGSIWIGTSDLATVELKPGGQITINAPPGKTLDLNSIYALAEVAGDQIRCWGMA